MEKRFAARDWLSLVGGKKFKEQAQSLNSMVYHVREKKYRGTIKVATAGKSTRAHAVHGQSV